MGAIRFDYDETGEAFLFTLDGDPRPPVPTLEGWVLREWIGRYASVYTTMIEARSQIASLDDMLRLENVTEDGLLDALVSYDRTGALGSRDWLEENLTLDQVMIMLQRIVRTHA